MSDLIRRSDALSMLADIKVPDNDDSSMGVVGQCAGVLMFISAVDAVEVVRCGDCIHMVRIGNAYYCKVWGGYNGCGIDGFCSYGERREDNDQI